MHPILQGAQLKIDRAHEKFLALKEAVKPFRTGEAYELVREPYKPMTTKTKLPPFLGVGVGEILHDLRSGLDHIAYELCRRHCETSGTDFDAENTQFPIFLADRGNQGSHVKSLRSGFSDKIKGQDGPKGLLQASRDVRTHIKGLQPFATGEGTDSPLWRLQELNNWDKHHTIYTTHLIKHAGSAEVTIAPGVVGTTVGINGPFEDETFIGGPLVTPRPGVSFEDWVHEVKVNFKFVTYVAFKDPTPCVGLPVDDVVQSIGQRVGEILKGIDKAFF